MVSESGTCCVRPFEVGCPLRLSLSLQLPLSMPADILMHMNTQWELGIYDSLMRTCSLTSSLGWAAGMLYLP